MNFNWHFRPIWYLSYPAISKLFGPSSFSHHATNLFIHLSNLILAYSLFRKWLGHDKALLVVMFWSILPQNAFAISWISQRNDLLMSFFILISLILAETRLRTSSFISFIFAFFSKNTCLMFPVMYLMKSGLKKTRSDFWIGLALLFFIFSITLYSLVKSSADDATKHLVNVPTFIFFLNYVKNFFVGWFVNFFPIPLFNSWLHAFSYFLSFFYLIHLIKNNFLFNKVAKKCFFIALLLSFPFMLVHEIRITYLMNLFYLSM